MKNITKIFFGIILICAVVFLVYVFSPLLYDKEVNEDFPVVNQANTVDVDSKEESVESQSESVNSSKIEDLNETEEKKENTLLYLGRFSGADSFHKVSGNALVYEIEGTKYLRFENFESTNGPDLKVYLSTDTSASDFISLGDLKGNKGDQNYEFSEDVDLEKYKYVLIWCEQFGVHFGNAELSLE